MGNTTSIAQTTADSLTKPLYGANQTQVQKVSNETTEYEWLLTTSNLS